MTLSFRSVPDKDELRRTAPLHAVAAAVGLRLDLEGRGLCPFHDDRSPSFGIWVDSTGVQRWGCFPCGVSGDAFDLVQRLETCSFGAAVRRVAEIAGDAPQGLSRPQTRPSLDRESLAAYVTGAQARAASTDNRGLLCVAASLCDESTGVDERLSFDDLLRSLGWGVDDRANVVVPHYSRDRRLRGAKVRALGGQKWSFPGSEYDSLYGCWLQKVNPVQCLLVEGETDYAHAMWEFYPGNRHVGDEPPPYVMSLPSGAGQGRHPRDEWIDNVVAFDDVYLAFDGDAAGREAEAGWSTHLSGRAGPRPRLWRCPVPEGHDLRSCGTRPWDMIRGAERVA